MSFRVIPHPVEAIQYTNQFSPEIRAFIGDIPHKFDNTRGIYIATLCGPVLVTSGSWMVKCPSLWEYIEFYKDEDFKKVFEVV